MPREEIHLDTALEELDAWTNAHCADSYDEPYLDANLNPITPQQLLDHIRELERKAGEKMIFQRGEGRSASPLLLLPSRGRAGNERSHRHAIASEGAGVIGSRTPTVGRAWKASDLT